MFADIAKLVDLKQSFQSRAYPATIDCLSAGTRALQPQKKSVRLRCGGAEASVQFSVDSFWEGLSWECGKVHGIQAS